MGSRLWPASQPAVPAIDEHADYEGGGKEKQRNKKETKPLMPLVAAMILKQFCKYLPRNYDPNNTMDFTKIWKLE